MSSASSVPGWLSPVLSAAWPVSNTLALALGVRPAAASPAASTSAAGADARFGAGHPIAPLSTHVALQAGGAEAQRAPSFVEHSEAPLLARTQMGSAGVARALLGRASRGAQ